MSESAYSWRVESRFGIRWLVLLDAAGRELRSRMCQSSDPSVQLAFVKGMILDHEKAAR
jgi:hypothetical protein